MRNWVFTVELRLVRPVIIVELVELTREFTKLILLLMLRVVELRSESTKSILLVSVSELWFRMVST